MSEAEYSIIPVPSLLENAQLDSFNCGNEEEELKINEFLKNHSQTFDLRGISKTFLYMRDKELVGFFSLCASETKVTRGFKRAKLHNRTFNLSISPTVFPSIELTYFAIKHSEQKKQLGTNMMYSVLEMLYYNVYRYVGFIMVTLESRNVATDFYKKMGFTYHKTKSGNDKLMALTITDIEALLGMSVYD